ncbi:MAG: hypothetical protein Q7J68_02560 [Thermoplasmata archaeon]|nr:hypothetical protein [Thermoplasmata archaeon]
MNPAIKFSLTMGVGLLAILLLLSVAGVVFNDVQDQPDDVGGTSASATVGDQLWVERNFDMLILSVMIFGSVLGVLALVGGGFKWQ